MFIEFNDAIFDTNSEHTIWVEVMEVTNIHTELA